jgi:hypothetical protein
MYRRSRAGSKQIGRQWRILPGIPLCYHQNRLLLAQRLNQLDRAITPNGQGQHRMRK